ncbi:magnesium transporter [Aeromonas sp. BIGb0405]|jgi:magnesium transporter|uniref:magnesium transporter n=1 Tax=unclassified Aeromonas TaxID=257493 RepID=UPI00216A5285|nr:MULTISPECIES: magnesium transporter [unclassified Aeromonas]MCS3455461.1 magnesium transporter [Aeromonas sp. BIGb0405]MCS3458441.1 magnesium transporter [Aeromonas sp. BIGb0445]
MKKTHLLLNRHQLLDLPTLQAWLDNELAPDARADQLLALRQEELNCLFDTLGADGARLLGMLARTCGARLLLRLHPSVLALVQGKIPRRELLAMLRSLGKRERASLLASLPSGVSAELKGLLRWPSESVGAHMRHDFFTLKGEESIASAKQRIHDAWDNAEVFQDIYVVDESGQLLGYLSLKTMLVAEPDRAVCELMERDLIRLDARMDQELAARMLVERDLLSLPVESDGRLLGIFHLDDAADILELESTEDAELQGGSSPLETPYLHATPWQLWRKRIGWLLILFVAEAYTGTVLRAFEEQLEAAIALAFFIPLLIGTGGNSGTQITTTLVRAMAVGEVSLRNLGTVLRKEISTAMLVSVAIAVAAWVRAWSLGVGVEVGVVVTLTIIAIVLWSAIVASIIPLLLRRLRMDPAVVSAPFISTLVDGTGLIIYFEIAKLILPELN